MCRLFVVRRVGEDNVREKALRNGKILWINLFEVIKCIKKREI